MATTVLGRRPRPGRLYSVLPWVAPLALLAVWTVLPGAWWGLVDNVVKGVPALAVLLVASRRPDRCMIALLALMPFQVYFPAWLYKQGVPVAVIRPITAWREVLGLAIVLAALRFARRHRHRLEAIDWLGFGYVVIVAAYALWPTLFADGAPTDSEIRSQAFRSSATFVILFLGCRHAGIGARGRDLAERALRWTALVVAAFAIWEFVDGEAWNRFAVETVEVTRYQLLVLESRPHDMLDVRQYGTLGGKEFVRVSSFMGSPLILGHYLLLPLAFALERALRGRTPGATAQAVLLGAGLLLTQTRSAMLGAVCMIAVLLKRAPGRSEAARSRFFLVLVGVLVAAAPFIMSAGLLDRFSDEDSNEAHEEGFFDGLSLVIDRPLGNGLGTSAGVGQRFFTISSITENYYLQVGTEMGALAMAVFVALVIGINRNLRRVRDLTGDAVVAAARSGFLGISVAAFFLHTYNNQTSAWTAFGVAGMALALGVTAAHRPDGPGGATMGAPALHEPGAPSRI